jgi:hypothetical protein
MVTDLTDMMYERLLAYQNKMEILPERVFVFRDGVSEVRSFPPLPISNCLTVCCVCLGTI